MDARVRNNRAAWLQGPPAKCSVPPGRSSHWRIVLLGAPGVGKGTQAQLLSERLGACHLSTGDVFRAAASVPLSDQSPAMADATQHMRKGELVPDATVWDIVHERTECLHCGGGFILDGFPRTVAQAESLQQLTEEEKIPLSAVVDYELDLDEIVSRLSGRRTCQQCKAVYHVSGHPPRVVGVCDACGGALLQREDDRPDAISVRMEAYEHDTRPLIEFYSRQGLLVTVRAEGSAEEICDRTVAALESRS